MQIKTETIVGFFILVALGIFFYMSFFLGVFRFDRVKYHSYTVYFNDVSGITKKSDVKIAGVKVGWVDAVELVSDHPYQAKASIMILKQYILYSNAHAIVRQEGLLGTKYLEVVAGNSSLPELPKNQPLAPSREPVSIDEILHKVQDIASNVREITGSLEESIGGPEGRSQLKTIFKNFQEAAERIAAVSNVLDRTLSNNEDSINSIVNDFKDFTRDIKESVPTIRTWVERVSQTMDRDISRIADKLEATSVAIEDAALNARDGFKSLGSVAEKLDEGRGVLGKLINEEETYQDLRTTIGGLKNYFTKVEQTTIVLDAHSEYMYRPAEHVIFEDAKGYFDIRLHPNEDHFYLFQIMSSQKGKIQRTIVNKNWYDERGRPLEPSTLLADGVSIPELIGTIETTQRTLDQYKFGFQFCKMFKNLAVRFGLFENTVGFGIDFDIPFGTDKFRWVTSLESFDFRGRDRIDDARPHLKWINRLFILRNIYMSFGADDFISKHNANGFFGAGIRFCDDDLKYLISQIGFFGFQ